MISLTKLLSRRILKRKDKNLIYYRTGGGKRKAHGTWYRGEQTNYYPDANALLAPNSIDEYVGKGWFPAKPFIDKQTYIAAFGSCFATNVTKFLHREGYSVFGRELNLNSHVVRSGEGIVNTASVLQQFEWAFENKVPTIELWHGTDGVAGEISTEVQAVTRTIFDKADVFILTLGLSEVWYDKPTGEIFWRAVPLRDFDASRHGFRVLGAEENARNLASIHRLIRTYRPEATIIMTLSPVPLAATFRPVSCMTANSVSKASLRIAIDEVMRQNADDPKLFYFPSYEMVTSYLSSPLAEDLRHPTQEAVEFIMQTFKRRFLL
jgi:hypothetical protein